ncbi:MAG: DUF58 domain-containing protein [Phycisphaerales bacterium]|jgi:uncharacterized protein (DUF58 family)|nr:DUF58 domain-containing protein [Phycisphaerales bacterium]MBT7171377.1 DUF58 domain-containing protein [Phycisphaerales bacterium]
MAQQLASKEELHQYLDPHVLEKIKRLDLRARHVVEGFISGLHRSPFQGFSVEFATHREYVPGDDIKHIDWKVQARTDRIYIKQYEEETNLKSTFLVDGSESMRFRMPDSDTMTKFDYAATCAAALAYMLQQQQDAVGLATFDEGLMEYIPPSNSPTQLKRMVHALSTTEQRKKTELAPVCHRLAEKMARRGMVCLVTDLFVDDVEETILALEHFRHAGHEVMLLHIMDDAELTFPFQSVTLFRGLEEMGEETVEPKALRDAYLEEVNTFLHEVKRRCAAARIDYRLVNTSEHLDAVLSSFLAARMAAARKMVAKR